MTTQDPELSAALGWPGGTGDPVLDRTRLLQMVAALRLASQQALEALEFLSLDFFMLDPISPGRESTIKAITALRAALAQQAEPVQPGAWVASKDGRVIYDDSSTDDSLLRVSGDFEDDEQRVRYAKQIVDKLNAAPAQQAEPVAADALTEPKSGDKWRVEWWNESCRMMLPAHAKLDSFVAYKNGTIQFTIKRTAA